MATSRSGGKIVTSRRKQRISATPYDRPPPSPSPPPPSESPNWFTSIVVPSARAIASGAGKIFSTIFSESESSSYEDEDSTSENDIDNDNHYVIPYNGVNMLNKKNVTSSEMMHNGQESQLMWRSETKSIIEQLIMKETFSREECDRLIKVLSSRVIDWSLEAGEKSSVAGSPWKTFDHEDVDIYRKAVQEAKTWFQEKKVGRNSMTELAQGTCHINSIALEHVESGGGSPVDVARSYMKDRAPWASPGRKVEIRTPLTARMKLFKEGTFYSAGQNSVSSSKKRRSLASGSWNIQEELRRVRFRATEDTLHNLSAKTDTSLVSVAQIRVESPGAGEKVSAAGESVTEPIDAGVGSDPALAAMESRQDGKANEILSSEPATSVSGNNEVSEAVLVDADCPAFKLIHLSNSDYAEEQHSDLHLGKINGSLATEVAEFGGNEAVNGLSSSQVCLSAGVAMGQNYEQHDDKNHKAGTVNEKPVNTINMEGDCQLLSEANMEVPVVTETNTTASGSQNSSGVHYEELSVEMAQPPRKAMATLMTGKQQGRKPSKYNRNSRVRGK